MFKNILIPLDGSRLGEAALAPAAILAQKFDSTVMLLHVIEAGAPAEIHNERHLTDTAEAEAYLKDTAARAFPPGLKVGTHVHSAPVPDVARSIVEHATAEFHPDLIVLTTHGKGGMRDVLFGSIAQQVVSKGRTPLMVVRPDQKSFQIKRIILPLDPDSIHDDSFPAAEALAQAFDAALVLLSVVPTYATVSGEQVATSSLMPASTKELLNLQEESSLEHLKEHVQTLRGRKFKATAEVARGDPAAAIIQAAEETRADLVVLSTHRKAGMEVFWSLSVAPKVVQRTKQPLLLIPLE
jgi:nucleotide-binding universal stress UspA family protein